MLNHIPINRLTTLAVAFLCAATKAFAGDTITIPSNFYHVDAKQHIIVINKKIGDINADADEPRTHLVLDKDYTFVDPTLLVNTNSSYQVKLQNTAYTAYFTELPIIHIDTENEIVDSPSVYAKFLMSEASGAVTESGLGIEIRGGFSQTYPKKSYELSFWNDTKGDISRDLSLLKMRTDNKWNLQALYNEPLRTNSKTSNELWQDIHQIYYKDKEPDAKNGIDMAYVEVFLNNEYKGLYALSERIDRKQLKLKKYNNGIIGELYKGDDWGGAVTFTSLPAFDNNSSTWGGFEYKHPEEKTDWTNLYNFVNFVENSSDQDFYSQYKTKFNLKNAVDYYIFLNLIRAVDNTGKNIYVAKYKTNEPYYYAPWDLDGTFGNNWFGGRDNVTNDILSNGFYKRLIKDNSPSGFNATLYQRWAELRATVITEDYILHKFKEKQDYLLNNNIYEREHLAWNSFTYDDTYAGYTATWLKSRLAYLDGVFSQSSTVLKNGGSKQGAVVSIYPNPANDFLFVETEALPYELSIQDMNGRIVSKTMLNGTLNKVAIDTLPKGLYMVTVKNSKTLRTQKLIIN
jgi:spore coat protein H